MIQTEEAKAVLRARNPQGIEDLTGKDGLVAEMTRQILQECVNSEMDDHLGFKKHDSPAYVGLPAKGKRNGTYKRKLRSSDGLVELEIPRDRDGKFKPKCVPHYKQVSSDLENKIMALYAVGTSTRDIQSFIYEQYGVEISDGFVSDVTDKILQMAKEWQTRVLQSVYPIVYLDAIHIFCRENSKVIKKAVYVVLAYDLEGKKEVLGQYISSGSEGAKYWLSVIQDLKNRGVDDIFIACVDGLSGFSEAINAVFEKTIVQRCVIHAIRNSLKYIPNKFSADFMEDLKPVYKADTKKEAEQNLQILEDNWKEKYPMAVQVWTNNWKELSQYFDWTYAIRKMIYTTNAIESFNSIIRKYTKNRRSFTTDDSLLKVLYIATEKATEKWDKARSDWPTVLNQFAIVFEGRVSI
jgi:transposase-like protein